MNKKELIAKKHNELKAHELYQTIRDLDDLRIFMKWHVFAVWDFMSLLKSMQREVTCVDVPWKPSKYSKDLVRFINEIVLGEESDKDLNGQYNDHFSMYIEAMNDIGAKTTEFDNFLDSMNSEALPREIRNFVNFNIELSLSNSYHNIASAFFWGRENLIPDIFEPIVKVIDDEGLDAPHLKYYLERHIELDGDEHGELARKCLLELCHSEEDLQESYETAILSLEYRKKMWDYITQEIKMSRSGASLSI